MSMLGFFRKRQKLIFVIMVVLMVSFLVGAQGLSGLFGDKQGKEIIGQTKDTKYTLNMRSQANNDLGLLQMILPGFGQNSEQGFAFQVLYRVAPSQDSVSLAYMLLLGEAKEAGYTVTDSEIQQAIDQMRNRGFDYDGLAGSLRQNRGMTTSELNGVLARWLMVFKNYQASNVLVPPSQTQVLNLFRDLNEKMNLSVAKLSADVFLDKVAQAEPTEAQINELFDKYKNRTAGQFGGFDSFDFGYLYQPAVKLAYIFVNQTAIERAVVPSMEDVQDYYNEHKYELQDAAGKVKSFTDAKSDIIKILAPQAGQAKFAQVIEDIERAVNEATLANKETGIDGKTFDEIVAKFTIPADDLLSRKIPIVAIDKQPLEEAIRTLGELVNPRLSAICFPWGKFEKITIDPTVKVSLAGRNMTVAEALDKIAAQIPDMPKLQWACFPGIDSVIFPVSGIRLFPVTAGQTGLETAKQLKENSLIANAASQEQRAWLLQLVMNAQAINPAGTLKVGQQGPIATLVPGGDYSGQLIWLLADAQPAKSPEEITPEIKKDIVRDWKLTQAYDLAVKATENVKTADEMQAFVKTQKLTPVETGIFARREQDQYGSGFFQLTQLPMLEFSDGAVDAYFIDEAFKALAPKDINKPYEKLSAEAVVLPVKCEEAIYLARRTDFLPATQQDFEKAKNDLINPMLGKQRAMSCMEWFVLDNILERTGFTEEREGTLLPAKK